MNKQQLIDKAIDDLGGEFPLQTRTYLHKAGCNYFSCESEKTGVIGSMLICTRKEFEARKAERSQEQHWYDYENQKALRLPPVGEVVLVSVKGHYRKAKVLEVTKNNCENLIACRVISKMDSRVGELSYFSDAKPLDWNKKNNDDMLKIAEIICEHAGDRGCIEAAKAILAAGYRKCDTDKG